MKGFKQPGYEDWQRGDTLEYKDTAMHNCHGAVRLLQVRKIDWMMWALCKDRHHRYCAAPVFDLMRVANKVDEE